LQSHPSRSELPLSGAATLDLSGRCVGNSYVLACPIGHGATGTVWRGVERVSGEQVAVKLLHESLLNQPKLVTRFVQERTILKMLHHENVVRVRDLLTVGESLGLVMDLITGGSLRDHLRGVGTLPAGEAARLLAQVAGALAEAHELGVVHRDVKPDNILLQRDDDRIDTRLTDFGIARVLDTTGLTTPHAVVGTPLYMAPEAITGGDPSPATDVYALGVVLHELVVGRPPYAGEPIAMLLSRHLEDVPEPAGMPPAAWSVVRSCLDRDPQRRPSAAELADTLRDLARAVADVPALPAPSAADLADGPRPAALPAHPSQRRIGRLIPRGRNRAHTGRWVRPGAIVGLIAGAMAASSVGAMGAWHLRDAGGSAPPAAAVAAPRAAQPSAAPSPSVPPPAGQVPAPLADRKLAAMALGTGNKTGTGASAGRVEAPPGPAGVGVSAGPGKVDAGAHVFGPWQCGETYTWNVGHPVLARPCHSVGGAVRVVGHLQASPGVQADVSLTVQDVDTGEVVTGPSTCDGVRFTDLIAEKVCGPFDLDAPHGRRYAVVLTWQYTGQRLLPGGTTRGPEFSW
jgi:tRNA A-37 threonylcarbamoyl transferase component Bud32